MGNVGKMWQHVREFRDVVFEDVFDNNRCYLILYLDVTYAILILYLSYTYGHENSMRVSKRIIPPANKGNVGGPHIGDLSIHRGLP